MSVKGNALTEILLEWRSRKVDLIEREVKMPVPEKEVIAIMGPRRAGKTYFMYQISYRLE